MFSVLVNGIAIIIGGFIGLLVKKRINEEYLQTVYKSVGFSVIVIALLGIIKSMVIINADFSLSTQHELLVIISLALGALIGEVAKIEKRLEQFSKLIEKKIGKGGFSIGFIDASLIFCVGAMAILGSVNAALGDPTILYLKSLLDGITSLILASTLGFGVLFSSVAVVVYQGSITLLTYFLGNVMTSELVAAVSAVGYVLVLVLGFNFVSANKVKVANLLPSLLVALIYFLLLK